MKIVNSSICLITPGCRSFYLTFTVWSVPCPVVSSCPNRFKTTFQLFKDTLSLNTTQESFKK